MAKLLLIASVLLCVTTAAGQGAVQDISWSALQQAGQLRNGAVLPAGGVTDFERLRIVGRGAEPATIELMGIPAPGVSAGRFALTGRVQHEGVEGRAYLEMWTHFPDGSFYFSRTLAEFGPMRHLEGTSGWREFELPFFNEGTPKRVSRIVLNVVFPGEGAVELTDLSLISLDPERAWPLTTVGAWIVALALALALGCPYALAARLAALGRAKPFVDAVLGVVLIGGIGLLVVAGVVALWLPDAAPPLPILVLGVLLVASGLVGIRWARGRYEDTELRQMDAMDAP